MRRPGNRLEVGPAVRLSFGAILIGQANVEGVGEQAGGHVATDKRGLVSEHLAQLETLDAGHCLVKAIDELRR